MLEMFVVSHKCLWLVVDRILLPLGPWAHFLCIMKTRMALSGCYNKVNLHALKKENVKIFVFWFGGETMLNWNRATPPDWRLSLNIFKLYSFPNLIFPKLNFYIPSIFTTIISCKLNERKNLLKNVYTSH